MFGLSCQDHFAVEPAHIPPRKIHVLLCEPDQSGDAGIKGRHHAALVTSVLFTWMLKALISNMPNFERYVQNQSILMSLLKYINAFGDHFNKSPNNFTTIL